MTTLGKSSFTLVELLIVIGILAILTSAVVITLNPAERLRESRDSQRIQELTSLEQTINLLLTQVPNLSMGTASTVYISIPDSSATCANLGLPTLPTGYTYSCKTTANYRKTDGTGWIPINFQSGLVASLPTLPVDPTNTTSTGLYYSYLMGGSFELNGLLESKKRRVDTDDDGGDSFAILEKGSNKTLAPYKDSGLVGYWTFDESTGTTAKDSSGNNVHGTLTNFNFTGASDWKSGNDCKLNSCLSFDGTGDYIQLGGTTGAMGVSDFSVSFWFKDSTTASGWYETYVSPGNGAGEPKWEMSWAVYKLGSLQGANADKVAFAIGKGAAANYFEFTSTIYLSDGMWHLFTGTADRDGNANIYIDGTYKNSAVISSVIASLTAVNGCSIGRNNQGSAYTDAVLDDVRIYNRALSAAEIQAIYNATK